MNRVDAWSFHTANLLVGGTGLIYAAMAYCLTPADEFAVVNHPLQPTVQHLHLWFAPLLVFAAGMLVRAHALEHVRAGVRARRNSGWTLLATLAPMVVSGYLIQTAVDPTWRTTWVVVHLVASGLWGLGSVAHLIGPLRRWWGRRAQSVG